MTDFADLAFRVDTSDLKKGEQAQDSFANKADQTERKTTKATTAITSGFRRMVPAIGAAIAALGAGVGFAASIREAEKFQTTMFRVEAVIKATGGAAGRSADQLRQQARELARSTLESTDGILKAQQTLLTFRNVQGDVFDRAIVAAADMAAALGGDLNSATMQLAKALENPLEGISALSRSGTVFTAAQKDMVRAMVEAGQTAEAQAFILDELEAQYKGTAEAAAGGLAGAQDALGQSFQELKLVIGDALLPAFTSLVRGFSHAVVMMTDVVRGIMAVGNAARNAYNFIFRLGKTSNQMGAEIDGATRALRHQEAALHKIAPFIEEGTTLTLNQAQSYLQATNAIYEKISAQREELRFSIMQSEEYKNNAAAISQLAAEYRDLQAAGDQGPFAPNASREGLEEVLTLLQGSLDIQKEILADADVLPEAYDAAKSAIARLEEGIEAAQGNMVTLLSVTEQSEDATNGIAAAAGSIDFSAAISGAYSLGNNLYRALDAAQALASQQVASDAARARIARAGLNTVGDPVARAGAVAVQGFREEFGDGGYGLIAGGQASALARAEADIRAAAESATALEMELRSADTAFSELARSAAGGGVGGAAGGGAAGAARDVDDALTDAQKAAKAFADQMSGYVTSAVGDVSKAFGDFVSRGFRDFKSFAASIVDTFKQMLSQMIALAAKNQIMIGINMGGAAGVTGGAGGMLNGLMSNVIGGFGPNGSIGGGLGETLGSLGGGTGFLGGAGEVLAGLSTGGLSGGFSAIGSALSGAAGGGLGGIASAAGALALPVAAFAAVVSFFSSSTKTLDRGIRVAVDGFDATVEKFKKTETTRFWGLSKTRKTRFRDDPNNPLNETIDDIQSAVADAANVLGFGANIFDDFAFKFRLSLKGLSEDQKIAKINQQLALMGDEFASLVPGFQSMNDVINAANQAVAEAGQLGATRFESEMLMAARRRGEFTVAGAGDGGTRTEDLIRWRSMDDVSRTTAEASQTTAEASRATADNSARQSALLERLLRIWERFEIDGVPQGPVVS